MARKSEELTPRQRQSQQIEENLDGPRLPSTSHPPIIYMKDDIELRKVCTTDSANLRLRPRLGAWRSGQNLRRIDIIILDIYKFEYDDIKAGR